MNAGQRAGDRAQTATLVALLLLCCSRLAFAQAESNPFSPRPEGQPREGSAPSSSAVETPVRSGLEGETLQLERTTPTQMAAPPQPLEGPVNADEYICGRGDAFELNFWGAQNFKVKVVADSEGRAFVPKVGYIVVADKTLAQARSAVKAAVHRLYPGLNFDMSLQQPRTFAVHVVGFVDKPGIYSATPVERVSVLVERAGLNGRGSKRRIEIRRRDGKTLSADLLRYGATGDRNLNPYVMDGDTITVPFAEVVVGVVGAVKRPGKVELITTKDVTEALDVVGGFSPEVTHVLPVTVVTRTKQDLQKQQSLPFGTNGNIADVPLHDGDSVFVPTVGELQRSILIVGPVPGSTVVDEVTATKRISFIEGSTVRTVVEGNGPLGASADLKNAYVKSDAGALAPIDLEALLVKRDFSKDREVHVGDTIVIPQRRLAVSVEGAVFRPGVYPFNLRFDSDNYIAVAGGPSRLAQGRDSYRLISPDGTVSSLKKNGQVAPGDTIILPERNFTRSEIVQLVMGGVGLALTAVSVIILTVRP